jgi:hypothetical protein
MHHVQYTMLMLSLILAFVTKETNEQGMQEGAGDVEERMTAPLLIFILPVWYSQLFGFVCSTLMVTIAL